MDEKQKFSRNVTHWPVQARAAFEKEMWGVLEQDEEDVTHRSWVQEMICFEKINMTPRVDPF